MKLFLVTSSPFIQGWFSNLFGKSYELVIISPEDRVRAMEISTRASNLLIDSSSVEKSLLDSMLFFTRGRALVILLMESYDCAASAGEYEGRAFCIDINNPPSVVTDQIKTLLHGLGSKEFPLSPKPECTYKIEHERSSDELCVSACSQAENTDSDKKDSVDMQKFLNKVKEISATSADILLLGESGSGKSYLAKKIHEYSGRSGGYLSESFANISSELFESALFGTEAGAFTGAKTRAGLLEAAGSGTLFLDEIGELPLHLQSKLFYALDKRKFRRLGSVKEQDLCARLIFATNKDLELAASDKDSGFRSELLSRINMITLRVPSLNEHANDIPRLAQLFARKSGKFLTSSALQKLRSHRYRWNIRELRNVVVRSCMLSSNSNISASDISFATCL